MKGWIRRPTTTSALISPAATPISTGTPSATTVGCSCKMRDEHERDDGHAAARQVDAAADDDERDPDGHDADDRDLPQDVQEVLRGEELRGQQRRAREQQHEDDYVRVRQQRPRWCT